MKKVIITKNAEKYIIKKAKQQNYKLPEDFKEMIKNKCVSDNSDCILKFSKGQNLTYTRLNANAGIFKFNSIVVTPEWGYQLLINEDSEMAFAVTIGHELSHKNKNISFFYYIINFKFCSWVNEVHADFGSYKTIQNLNREDMIFAFNFKINYKKIYNIPDIDTLDHPSFARRLHYIRNYNFDKFLIQKIAFDSGCKNKMLITKITKYFSNIILD